MAQTSFLFLTVGLFYCIVSGIQAENVQSGPGSKESSMFKAFLKSLVNMNGDRLSTMKKLAKLQDRNMDAPTVKSVPGIVEDNDNPILAHVQPDESEPEQMNEDPAELENDDVEVDSATDFPVKQEIMTDDVVTKEIDMVEETTSGIPQVSMKKLKGCLKKSGKLCKRACVSAGKTVCSRYPCDKKVKKALKKECKSACKAAFE